MLLLSLEFLSKRSQNNIQTFDAIKPETLFKIAKIKNPVTHRLICQSFSASGLQDLPSKTVNRRFRRVYIEFQFSKLLYFLSFAENISSSLINIIGIEGTF
jgi:hypothetical protein